MWTPDACALGLDLVLQYIAAANDTVDAKGALREATGEARKHNAQRRLVKARVKAQSARQRLLRHRLEHDCFSTIVFGTPEGRRKSQPCLP